MNKCPFLVLYQKVSKATQCEFVQEMEPTALSTVGSQIHSAFHTFTCAV